MRSDTKGRNGILRVAYYSFLLLSVVCVILLRNNIGWVYAKTGDFYFKHNNIFAAQNFYEKSFAAGNINSETREIYVNSLINSPLSIESQEKLVKMAEGDIQDKAAVKAKSFLYDLMREIHKKYPENYIQQASYNKKIVHWGSLPITYTIRNCDNQSYVSAIEDAFNTWDKSTSHKVIFSRVNSDDANIVIDAIQNKGGSIEYGKKYIIAYTMPIINGNKLERMEIKLCLNKPDGEMYTPNQIYNTVLHEIFHALGYMGHSSNRDNIMYMSKEGDISKDDKRKTLNDADTSTLDILYSTKPDITNDSNIIYKYVPYFVLGDDTDKNILKTREAKRYITKAPSLPNGYIDLAETLVAEKKYAQAIKNLEKALTLSDTYDAKYIVYYNLAVSYYYIGHYEMALDYIDYARKIHNNDELDLLSAEIFLKQKKYDEAIKMYKRLTAKSPDNIDYTINLTNIYIKKRDYLNARAILKKYLKRNPKDKNSKRIKHYGILAW